MALFVQKYGGKTLETPNHIRSIAQRIAKTYHEGHQLIIVVSAMGSTTDELLGMAEQVSQKPHKRELDVLLTAGERISMSLLCMALHDLNCPAISFTGSQAGVLTNESHREALIKEIKPIRVKEELEKKNIVVLAGFQGVSPISKDITTLGRGGSDMTAVAVAAHFKAERCEILKEVEGVYTTDPRICSSARLIPTLHYEELYQMTFWGAKVVYHRAVAHAAEHNVPLSIGLAHNENHTGTLISSKECHSIGHLLSINSFPHVLIVNINAASDNESLDFLRELFEGHHLAQPHFLSCEKENHQFKVIMYSNEKNEDLTHECLKSSSQVQTLSQDLSSISMTFSKGTSPSILKEIHNICTENDIDILDSLTKANTLTLFVHSYHRKGLIPLLEKMTLS